MRKWLSAASVALMVLGLSGCAHAVQGTAAAPPERCPVKGYEEVLTVSAACGQTVAIQGLGAGFTARPVTLDGHQVMYLINNEALNRRVVYPPSASDSDMRTYVHAIVDGVDRYPGTDVVQIDVSDDCPLEERYDNLFADINCSPALPDQHGSSVEIVQLGVQLETLQAAIVLGQSMVNQIEAHAKGSGRDTVYVMTVDKLNEP